MRIVIVSNRLPFTATFKDGKLRFKESSGGLVTGMRSYLDRHRESSNEDVDYLWVGWPGATVDEMHREAVRNKALKDHKAYPIFLPEEAMEKFYHGFCNKTIWPLFHYFNNYTEYDEDFWDQYEQVNQAFMDALMQILQPGDAVWVHDYQLMLLPRMIRNRFMDMPIGFFLHIPFPSFEVFRLLPNKWKKHLMEGMLGSSLIGFHTHDYTRHFLSCTLRTLGFEHHMGQITTQDRVVRADTFPMGIDFEKFHQTAASEDVRARVAKLRKKFGSMKVIFSVDRLDYTKGIVNRLKGYETFLQENTDWHGKVAFVLTIVPSRVGVETYQQMKKEIDELVGRINGNFGNIQWTPILYQYRSMTFPNLVAMYACCDVALLTPLRDGMNLVAKEFMASRVDQTGVLVLSEMAGASKEMGEAIIINPFHHREVSEAIEQALRVPVEVQKKGNAFMQERLRSYNVIRWAEDFITALMKSRQSLQSTYSKFLTPKVRQEILGDYQGSARRALFLDYDGTLVPFVSNPKMARPDRALLETIGRLCADENSDVFIISGRSRHDLEEWFEGVPLGLIAEHGVWIREKGTDWRQLKTLQFAWKEQIRPILRLYVDRLPGAFLEEKDYSLVWHYRRADPEQGRIRATELVADLVDYTANMDLQVLEGNKVIEVRNAGINKGTAAVEMLSRQSYEFVMAVGDDWTDEDTFKALPEGSHTIKVGINTTNARYNLGDHRDVRKLLEEMSRIEAKVESSTST